MQQDVAVVSIPPRGAPVGDAISLPSKDKGEGGLARRQVLPITREGGGTLCPSIIIGGWSIKQKVAACRLRLSLHDKGLAPSSQDEKKRARSCEHWRARGVPVLEVAPHHDASLPSTYTVVYQDVGQRRINATWARTDGPAPWHEAVP